MQELPILQKTYDFVKWYIPILGRLPKQHKFNLGNRISERLFEFLEILIDVQFQKQKLPQLEQLNRSLAVLRYQNRLLFDLQLMDTQRYEYIIQHLDDIGTNLGGWIKQQRSKVTT
ncbi:MAG: diversity-generating retroelement protein Avd [Prochlorotrichaceae cyanobacterium]|jgi:hypothetical protein